MTQSLEIGESVKAFTTSNSFTLQSAICVLANGCHIIKLADMIYLAINF